jgi:hypothetical protein
VVKVKIKTVEYLPQYEDAGEWLSPIKCPSLDSALKVTSCEGEGWRIIERTRYSSGYHADRVIHTEVPQVETTYVFHH